MKTTMIFNKKKSLILLFFQVLLAFIFSFNVYSVERVDISRFSDLGIDNWKVQKFKDKTSYTVERSGGTSVVKAESFGSASAIIREIDVDLTKTPFLNWSWKIDKVQSIDDEQIKSGDDFSARVYVIVKESVMIWRAKALNYVWSASQPIGNSWTNPYAKSVKMIALRSGNEDAGKWTKEKRDIRADLKKMFGYDIQTVNGIAIMTDTDNSKGSAVAYYGELYFTSQ